MARWVASDRLAMVSAIQKLRGVLPALMGPSGRASDNPTAANSAIAKRQLTVGSGRLGASREPGWSDRHQAPSLQGENPIAPAGQIAEGSSGDHLCPTKKSPAEAGLRIRRWEGSSSVKGTPRAPGKRVWMLIDWNPNAGSSPGSGSPSPLPSCSGWQDSKLRRQAAATTTAIKPVVMILSLLITLTGSSHREGALGLRPWPGSRTRSLA